MRTIQDKPLIKKRTGRPAMLRVGLTGGIGSGKSTVSEHLRKGGWVVLDADQISRDLVQPGSRLLADIARQFGRAVIQEGGELDRRALGCIVFADGEARTRLNRLLHGPIMSAVAEAADRAEQQGEPAVFVDAALLFETGMETTVDEVWLVDVDEDTQIRRVTERDQVEPDEVRRRMASQMSRQEKLARADVVLDNSRSPDELKKQIDRLLIDRFGNAAQPANRAAIPPKSETPSNPSTARQEPAERRRTTKTPKAPLILLMLLLGLSGLAGCAKPATPDTADNGRALDVQPVIENVISMPIEPFRTLNPITSRDEDVYHLDKLIYQGLFRLTKGLVVEGDLAADYAYLEDGKAVEIRLKKGVRWQNGEELTARDVKFTIEAYQLAGAASLYEPYVCKIDSATVKNDQTLVIRFKDQKDAAIANLTFPIVCRKAFATTKAALEAGRSHLPVGSGPYMVESIVAGRQIALVPNPNYDGAVPENRLNFIALQEKPIAAGLFEIGELNVGLLKESDRDARFNGKPVRIVSFPSNEVEVLGFRFAHDLLKNPVIRKAIALAIDDQTLIEGCYHNCGMPNDTIFFPEYLGIGKPEPLYPVDAEKAKVLLKQAGVGAFGLRLLYNSDNPARTLAARQISQDLGKIGIAVQLHGLAFAEYERALERGEYDLFIGGYRLLDTYDLRPLLATGGNVVGYSNPVLDSLLDRLQSGITAKAKKEAFTEARKILRTDLPYYCLCYKTYGLAVSENLTGNVKPLFQNIYNQCDTFRLTKPGK